MMTPAGFQRGRLTGHFCSRLLSFVEQKALSVVTGAETGFLIAREPDTVRAPGVAFVRAERVPSEPTPGFLPGFPGFGRRGALAQRSGERGLGQDA